MDENMASAAENPDVIDLGLVSSDDVERSPFSEAWDSIEHMSERCHCTGPKLGCNSSVREKCAHTFCHGANGALCVSVRERRERGGHFSADPFQNEKTLEFGACELQGTIRPHNFGLETAVLHM